MPIFYLLKGDYTHPKPKQGAARSESFMAANNSLRASRAMRAASSLALQPQIFRNVNEIICKEYTFILQ